MMTVADVMRRDVVTIESHASARDLAQLLSDEEISGMPVVDGQGNLVGVVSQTDLVRLAAEEAEVPVGVATHRAADPDELDPYGFFLTEDSPFSASPLLDAMPESTFDSVRVEQIMTPVLFSVPPTLPLEELAEYLMRGRIHRALVVVGEQLEGIVTSHDVLRQVAEGRFAR